eukprot:5901907-Amphidinium_carterae.2
MGKQWAVTCTQDHPPLVANRGGSAPQICSKEWFKGRFVARASQAEVGQGGLSAIPDPKAEAETTYLRSTQPACFKLIRISFWRVGVGVGGSVQFASSFLEALASLVFALYSNGSSRVY